MTGTMGIYTQKYSVSSDRLMAWHFKASIITRVKFRVLNLALRFSLWRSTVLLLICRFPAISLLLSPCAVRATMSFSCAVTAGRAGRYSPGKPLPGSASPCSRRNCGFPRLSMAAFSSSGSAFLVKKPSA